MPGRQDKLFRDTTCVAHLAHRTTTGRSNFVTAAAN